MTWTIMSNNSHEKVGILLQIATAIFLFANMSRPAAGSFNLPAKEVLGTFKKLSTSLGA